MFANESSALHSEASGKNNYVWTENMEDAFIDLNKAFITPPELAFPSLGMPFVETDASTFAIREIMTQKKDYGTFHLIHIASRTIIDAERRYETYERDALAIIFAMTKFRIYVLSSQPFKLVMDHKALSYTF